MMKLNSGFKLLIERKNKVDIEALEEKYDIILPPKYKLCVSLFELELTEKSNERVILNGEMFTLASSVYGIKNNYSFDDDDVLFEGFIRFEDVMSQVKYFDYWFENKRFPIAYVSGDGDILLGTSDKERDKILVKPFGGGEIRVIEDDIFDFILNLELILNKDFLEDNGISLEQLYKNFQEDFWRVRDKNKE